MLHQAVNHSIIENFWTHKYWMDVSKRSISNFTAVYRVLRRVSNDLNILVMYLKGHFHVIFTFLTRKTHKLYPAHIYLFPTSARSIFKRNKHNCIFWGVCSWRVGIPGTATCCIIPAVSCMTVLSTLKSS